MAKIKAVIFDLDNTLIDFIKMKEEACRAAVGAMVDAGLKMNRKLAYRKMMETYFSVGIESDRAFTEFLKRETGKVDARLLAAALNAYLKAKDDFLLPYPEVGRTLAKLKKKGLALAIVTDAPKVKAYQRLLAMGMDKMFDLVIGFEDTSQKKSTGIPLRVALQRLNLRPEEVLAVGDSMERDVEPARKIGMGTVLARYGMTEDAYGSPDYSIDGIEKILEIL
jgi:HAD superfamily hydrolase (TIGR01509 family)